MVTFCKNKNCPTSHDLLAFQTGKISRDSGEAIKSHIKRCEFCEAEIEFYTRYPQTKERVKRETIPPPLYELAEALLKKKDDDFTTLNKLISQKNGFELKKA